MLIWTLKFAVKLGFTKLTERMLRKTLSKKLLKIVRNWATNLPENASVNADAIWVDPFVEIKKPQVFSCRMKLQHQIRANEIPSLAVWGDAFLEKWKYVKKHVEDPQPLFKLDQSQAIEYLLELSRAVYNEYTQDPVNFRRAVMDALYKRGHVDTESIEDAIAYLLFRLLFSLSPAGSLRAAVLLDILELDAVLACIDRIGPQALQHFGAKPAL